MKKRKKKPSQVQRQKLEAAHFKNEFFIRLKNLCKIMGVAEVYNMIPSGDLENIFALRFQAPRVMAAAGFQVPNAVLNDVSHIFTEIFKNYLVPISKDGIEISFYDYLTIFMTLIFYGSALENHPHAKSDAIIKSLKHFDDYLMAEEINKSKLLQRSMMYISELESDIRSAVYWLRIESMVDEYKGKTGAYSFIYIYSHTPEKKSFVIDHVSRPALRVGWGVSVMHKTYDYIKIPAEKVRSDYNIKNLTFDVYIQSHALQRLDERLDGLRPGLMHSQLYFSLLTNPGIQWDKGGNLLLDMKLWDIKVGYLLADIVDSAIVIRSFLFLTHSGTPEGDKLLALTGLEKEDKKYLQIDKLSTFLASDIQTNQKVKNIFVEAGCGSLFELDQGLLNKHIVDQVKPKADLILEYLGLNKSSETDKMYEEESKISE